jgi:hypothetical protein
VHLCWLWEVLPLSICYVFSGKLPHMSPVLASVFMQSAIAGKVCTFPPVPFEEAAGCCCWVTLLRVLAWPALQKAHA